MSVLTVQSKEWWVDFLPENGIRFNSTTPKSDSTDIDVEVTLHYELKPITDHILNCMPFVQKTEASYIKSLEKQLNDKRIQGIFRYWGKNHGQQELLGIKLLISKGIWQEIRNKITVPPPVCILSIIITEDDYNNLFRQTEPSTHPVIRPVIDASLSFKY